MSKLFHYIICCNFKINVMHIYFKDFLTFIVKCRFVLNSRLNSWLIWGLPVLVIKIKFRISIELFIWVIILKSVLLDRRLSVMLINILILYRTHIIRLVMIFHGRLIPLLSIWVHPHMHLWSTSILIHFWLVMLIGTMLSLSIMIILRNVRIIPNRLVIVLDLSVLNMLIVRLRSIKREFSLVWSLVVHLSFKVFLIIF